MVEPLEKLIKLKTFSIDFFFFFLEKETKFSFKGEIPNTISNKHTSSKQNNNNIDQRQINPA